MTDSHKQHSLDEELRVSIVLVKTGLRELNREGAATDFFHLPILLISTGIERFIKVIICLQILETSGRLPDDSAFKQKPKGHPTHGLRWLLSQVTQKYFSNEFLQKNPATASNIEFIATDENILKLIEILSDFSMGAIYYNMNIVSQMEPPGACQVDEWEKLRVEILEEEPNLEERIQNMEENTLVDKEICSRITVSCEMLMRALSRLVTFEKRGNYANQISVHTHHFLFLTDENLGKTDYNLLQI